MATDPATTATATTTPTRRRPTPRPGPQLRRCAGLQARTSTPWSLLPAKELGCGSATTCWRRLDELGEAGRIDLERVSVDCFSLRAVKGGTWPASAAGGR